MAHGGKRSGSGRPKLMDAAKVQKMCQAALIKMHGSLEAAIEKGLTHPDASIQKFFYQHAFGNIPQTVNSKVTDGDGKPLLPSKIIVEVVRTDYNKDVKVNGGSEDTNSNSL